MRILVRHNRHVIDRTNPCQVTWWAAELGASEVFLLNAIAMIGHQAHDVDFYLRVGKPRRRPERQSADAVPTSTRPGAERWNSMCRREDEEGQRP